MKKVFVAISLVVSVGISSLFLLSSADKKISSLFQKILGEKKSSVPLVFVSVDDYSLEKIGSPFIAEEIAEKAFLSAFELGAFASISDLSPKTPAVLIDSLVEKRLETPPKERKMPFLNAKIVFPTKNNSEIDTKTQEIVHGFIQNDDLPYSVQLLGKKNDTYFADAVFAQILKSVPNVRVKISSSEIIVKNLLSEELKIPRSPDGSTLLKYPAGRNPIKKISFSAMYELNRHEENFYAYLKQLAHRGLFAEINSQNPIEIYEKALAAKKTPDDYKNLKNQFYVLSSSFLSGNQERILTETATDEPSRAIIKNSFTTARKLFSEIETLRTKISEDVRDSVCVFAFESENPMALTLSSMIFSNDFIDSVSAVFSVLIAVLLSVILSLVFFKARRFVFFLAFSVFYLIFAIFALIFVFFAFKIFVSVATPIFSVFVFSLILNLFLLFKNNSQKNEISALFSQSVPEILLKDVYRNPKKYIFDGEKTENSVLSLSIQGIGSIKNLLNETQFVAFYNHWFEKISDCVTKFSGIVESYDTSEVTALFGSPLENDEHCLSALKTALSVRDAEKFLNKEIHYYPLSPKPDGMNDELYTAFFILNHNSIKIFSSIAILTGEVKSGNLGDKVRKNYRILDDSLKNAASLRKIGQKYGAKGVILDENAEKILSDSYILRSLSNFQVNAQKSKIYELMASKSDDDDKLFNYVNYWNQAIDLLERGEVEKSLGIFQKLLQGRPNDKVAQYFCKNAKSMLNLSNGGVE